MSDLRKSFLLAIFAALLYAVCVLQPLAYLGRTWRVVVFGDVGVNWPGVSNLAWFGMLLAGLVFGLTPVFLLLLRKVGRRESGGMMQETQRGIQRGTVLGVDRLREELES